MSILDQPVRFGKHKGATWAAVLEEAPSYIAWAVAEAYWLSDEEREELQEELDASGHNWNRR